MTYNIAWDPNVPQASESPALGDDRIREMKGAIDERLSTLMDWPSGEPLRLLPNVIQGSALADFSIGTTQLANDAVISEKILNDEIPEGKFTPALRGKLPQFVRMIFSTPANVTVAAKSHQIWDITAPGVTATDLLTLTIDHVTGSTNTQFDVSVFMWRVYKSATADIVTVGAYNPDATTAHTLTLGLRFIIYRQMPLG